MAKTEKRVPRPYENLVRVIGAEATLRLCQEYGGEVLYIPKVDKLDALTRNASIRRKWNGRNAAELAKEYGVSVRWIQKTVEGLPEPPLPGQLSMTDLVPENNETVRMEGEQEN